MPHTPNDDSATSQPRSGFISHFRKSPVTDPWEPLFSRATDRLVEIGLLVGSAHCNSRGWVHGGVIATLADNAMGLTYHVARRSMIVGAPSSGGVTVNLSVDYIATAVVGQWLQFTPRVVKAGPGFGFIDCVVTADDGAIARASAVFKVLKERENELP